jgi:hypothetical protein
MVESANLCGDPEFGVVKSNGNCATLDGYSF